MIDLGNIMDDDDTYKKYGLGVLFRVSHYNHTKDEYRQKPDQLTIENLTFLDLFNKHP